MTKRTLLLISLCLWITKVSLADEGMWVPFKLKEQIIRQMQEMGLKLTANELYTPDSASINQAVVGLGLAGRPFRHFCTGGLVSNEGLFITNHHCGYSYIQQYSTLDHDYLSDGFWAYDKSQELQATNLTASILIRMEDVTDKVLENITPETPQKNRDSIVRNNIKKIEQESVKGTHYKANISSFFGENEFYLSVYEIFEDVRLVGAPPSAIGKFGGDTDNWVWPRHTGDFCLFRIYAGPDNKPAPYSPNNKPYKPTRFFKINPEGVSENTFTFVMGYPGTTQQYLPSYAIEFIKNVQNPLSIHLRDIRIKTMKKYMEINPQVRIQYSAKVASSANAWKKWIGENQGLERFNVVQKKQELEQQFQSHYANQEPYNSVLANFKTIYQNLSQITPNQLYFSEGVFNIELLSFAGKFENLWEMDSKQIAGLINQIESFHKDYYAPIDREIFVQIIAEFDKNVSSEFKPELLQKLLKKYNNNPEKLADWLFSKSIFLNKEKTIKLLETPAKNRKTIESDPAFQLYQAFDKTYTEKIRPMMQQYRQELPTLNRRFISGLRQIQPSKTFFPDANSTFRIAYGAVRGYSPRDAVIYHYQTTLDGIMEKDNPEIYDYNVPQQLREIYRNKDFGNYTTSEGKVPVCFAATNHTTG
ncbi:MAG TPA: S46 family peptidase, partial [Salinivirgaceae bacterium]|nr:S46 family peptidase [Salinivirgaceae bacterium]